MSSVVVCVPFHAGDAAEDVHCHKRQVCQHLVHLPLEAARSVAQPEGHHTVLVESFVSDECGLVDIAFCYPYMMVA
jgi:hypothetical protein